jgi:hypothetical protein
MQKFADGSSSCRVSVTEWIEFDTVTQFNFARVRWRTIQDQYKYLRVLPMTQLTLVTMAV